MHRQIKFSTWILGSFLFAVANPSEAQYVRVSADAPSIRMEPSSTAELVVQAQAGDTFELKASKGDWFAISMFSGEYRYLHHSAGQPTTQAPALPADQNVRRNACIEIVKAQDRAGSEAERRFPSDFNRQSISNGYSMTVTNYQSFASIKLRQRETQR